eukprot:5037781-Amphidinium_carterae.3
MEDLAMFIKTVEATGQWLQDIREMMYLQQLFPKELRCFRTCLAGRVYRPGRGAGIGRGALDETFDVAFDTELTTASDTPQAGIFLDCSKCYERVPLHTLETFALESGYPTYALYAALESRHGRRILIQGAANEPVYATHGMPLGCGHAAVHVLCGESLPGTPESSPQPPTSQHEGEPQEDWCFATELRPRDCSRRSGTGHLPPLKTQWAAWRCPVQKKRVMTFKQSMIRV